MITATDLRNGTTFRMDGILYECTYFQHVKPGKGGAFVKTKIKNIKLGTIIDKTFSSPGIKIEDVSLDDKRLQYSYNSGDDYIFIDTESFEQYEFTKEQIGDSLKFLKEEMEVKMLIFEGEVLGISLPLKVDLKVIEAPPGVKGNSAGAITKPVTLETGAIVNVPMFIKQDEMIKIDTRTGEYIERSKTE